MENKIQHSKPVPPFVRYCAANIPMVFDDSLSYYEALCALWKWLQTDVIDVINNNARVTEVWREELTTFENNVTEEIEGFETVMRKDFADLVDLFNQLQAWVDNYFENLDVQEEINNKLDEMAEDGTLADIIAAYIQLKGILAYENVNALKNAENIVAGSFCETYGYYTKGDGGSAKYIIREVTNDDTIDEMFIISITADPTNTLIAELIQPSVINVKQLGIKGDNSTDETTKISNAISAGKPLYFPTGTYLVSSTITAPSTVNIIGDGESTVFNSTNGTLGVVLDFTNSTTIHLCDFSTSNSTFALYPTPPSGKTVQDMINSKDIYICNVLCNTVSTTISGNKTNWAGLFINTPKPNHYSPRDFEDGKYSRYGIEIFNNAGYNAINIENQIKDDEGNYQQVLDNSAIGIVDGVLSSAPALFLDMHAERCAIGVKNRTATSSSSSSARPDTVMEVGYNGHMAIGCSVYDETGAAGVGTIKLKDADPSIRFYEEETPTHIAMIRLQNDKFQFLANGAVRSEYLNNGYHEYSYPIRIKKISDSHGGLIFGSEFADGSDMHMFAGSNGYLKVNRTAVDGSQTADSGYLIQQCASGNTGSRPTSRMTNDWQSIGFRYFDTTLGKPIFWNGSGWVDATGASV